VEADAKRGTIFIASLTDSTVIRKTIEIENIFENKLLITSDLSGIDWVVTEGAPYLSDGAKISINN
jgi:hypothetical protein